jgi:hypothetical protein
MSSILAGCAGPAAAPAAALTADQVGNAEYQSDVTPSKKAKLVAGKYEEAAAPGSASKITVNLVPTAMGLGDLNGDGVGDAAVILASSGGGSGTFISLHAVVSNKGALTDAAWTNLGDRTSVKAVTVSAGVITVNMVKHGPNDPLCCPTVEATAKYKIQDGKLVVVP